MCYGQLGIRIWERGADYCFVSRRCNGWDLCRRHLARGFCSPPSSSSSSNNMTTLYTNFHHTYACTLSWDVRVWASAVSLEHCVE